MQELHEVREVNRALEELRRFGLKPSDLVPAPRIAGREPPPRLVLENGEHSAACSHLRDLVVEVRKLGERGLTITRFKGLGEMDPEELWDTTLDPDKRILLQVQLDDALKADEMFRILMGEKVEPRRDFIIRSTRWRSRTSTITGRERDAGIVKRKRSAGETGSLSLFFRASD